MNMQLLGYWHYLLNGFMFFLYSSVFREMKKYQKDFSCWCGECLREKKERQRASIAATKSVNVVFVFLFNLFYAPKFRAFGDPMGNIQQMSI